MVVARKNPADVVQERARRGTQGRSPIGEAAQIPMTEKGAGPVQTYGQMIEDKLRGRRKRIAKRNADDFRRGSA